MASKKITKTPPSLTQLQPSLSSLTTAAHILDGFAHRNKNQHRATRWWGPFDMLRRSLHKTLPDLEAAVQRAEIMSSSSTSAVGSKRKRTAGGGGGAVRQAKQPELDRVAERATWTRDVVGPRAFKAFTQLAADRQFAQLGLVLIGVLAQVDAAIAPLARKEEAQAPAPQGEEQALLLPQPPPTAVRDEDGEARGTAVPRERNGGGGALDFGVAVSRDELESPDRRRGDGIGGDEDHRGEIRPSVERVPPPTSRLLSSPKAERNLATEKKRKKQKVEGAAASRVEMDSEPPARPAELKESKKKKKKKKKGGDEFDDLFSSLI